KSIAIDRLSVRGLRRCWFTAEALSGVAGGRPSFLRPPSGRLAWGLGGQRVALDQWLQPKRPGGFARLAPGWPPSWETGANRGRNRCRRFRPLAALPDDLPESVGSSEPARCGGNPDERLPLAPVLSRSREAPPFARRLEKTRG